MQNQWHSSESNKKGLFHLWCSSEKKNGTVCSISEWLRAEFKLDVCPNGPININLCLHLLFAMRVPLFLFNLHKCNCCGQIPQEHPSRICEHVIPYYPIYPYCQLRLREKTQSIHTTFPFNQRLSPTFLWKPHLFQLASQPTGGSGANQLPRRGCFQWCCWNRWQCSKVVDF